MKIAVWSDLHLNEWRYGSSLTESGYNTRLSAQVKSAYNMLNYCHHRGIKHIAFCGDFFHTHSNVSTQALQAANSILTTIRYHDFEALFLVGNHDMSDKRGKIHSLDLFRNYGEVAIGELHMDFSGMPVHAHAYTEDEDTLKRFLDSTEDGSLVFMHQGVSGVEMGSGWVINEILKPEMVPDRVNMAFTGHYHQHKEVSENLTVVGSFTAQTWADVNEEKGFLIYDTESKEVEHIALHVHPRFIEIEYGDEVKDGWLSHDFLRVKCDNWDQVEDFKKRRKAAKLEFQVKEEQAQTGFHANSFDLEPIINHFNKGLTEEQVAIGKRLRETRETS